MTSPQTGCVLYCDGGANPNPNGPSGSGVHGYIYIDAEKDEKPFKIDSWVTTDEKYVMKKDFSPMVHKLVKPIMIVEIVESIGLGTNNIAELKAVVAAMEFALTLEGNSRVHIICDSEYTLKGMNTWSEGWKKNGWRKSDGSAPSNLEIWRKLDDLKTILSSKVQLTSAWTKGHSVLTELGNDTADCMATMGVVRSAKGNIGRSVAMMSPVDYFSKKESIHPFISLKRVLFSTSSEWHQPGMYYQADGAGKDHVTGKQTSEATYSVVCLQDPDKILESVVGAVCNRDTASNARYNRIVYARTDMLKSQDLLHYLKTWGEDALIPDRRNLNQNFLDRRPVVVEVRGDELPLRAFDALSFLESLLITYQECLVEQKPFFEGDVRQIQIFDVTDHFYDTKVKRSGKAELEVHELKKQFGVGCVNTRVKLPLADKNASEVEVILSFGEDVPPRNTFRHIEVLNPSIHVITWKEAETVIRYATIVKTDDAVGIWANYFANNILLKK